MAKMCKFELMTSFSEDTDLDSEQSSGHRKDRNHSESEMRVTQTQCMTFDHQIRNVQMKSFYLGTVKLLKAQL